MGKFEDFDLDIKNVRAENPGASPDSFTGYECTNAVCESLLSIVDTVLYSCWSCSCPGSHTENEACQQSQMICTKAGCKK